MTAAMMLPSSLPLIRYFVAASQDAPGRATALVLFLLAYFGVWTAFALLAFTGDMVLHRIVDAWPALDAHPQIIAGTLSSSSLDSGGDWMASRSRCMHHSQQEMCRGYPVAEILRSSPRSRYLLP